MLKQVLSKGFNTVPFTSTNESLSLYFHYKINNKMLIYKSSALWFTIVKTKLSKNNQINSQKPEDT
jgi:hypothetical protein